MRQLAKRMRSTFLRPLLLRPRPRLWLNYLKFARTTGKPPSHRPDRLNYTPPDVTVWVTGRCNKACHFCSYRGGLNQADAQRMEMSYETFLRILNHRLVSKCVRLCLYGGEPLLNKDLFKMIRGGKKRGHVVTVSTNGLLLKERLSEIRDDPPHMFSISYYPEDVDKLADSMPAVCDLAAVKLLFLLSPEQLDEARNVLEFAITAGVHLVCFERICPTGFYDSPPLADDDPRLTDLESELSAEYGSKIAISWPRPSREARSQRTPICRIFWSSMFIDAMGRLLPCCDWPMSEMAGDIFSVDDEWNSQRMVSLRRDMRNGRFASYCVNCPCLYDESIGI